ncbi:MAG: lysylphosphatidylglycerol synthase transmembrane domain-containing protein [Burkholderiales bacterium]
MTALWRAPWLRALVALLTVAVLAWLLRHVDWAAWWARLRTLPGWLWAVVPLGMGLSYLARAARVHAELSLRQPVSLWHCLRLSLVHNLAIHVVPMRGGELAYPALLQRELGVPLGSAMASLAWMRLQDALMLLAAVVLLAPLPWPGRIALLGVAGLGLVAGVRWARGHAQALIQRAADAPEPSGWRGRLGKAWRTGLQALTDPSRHTGAGWLYCAGNWALKLLVIGSVLAALSATPLATALRGALGGELAALSPLQGPSGLGTYEAGVWLGMRAVPQADAASTAAVALAALTAHALVFLTALVAGLLAMLASARARRAAAS